MYLRQLAVLAMTFLLAACTTNPHKATVYYDRATFTDYQASLGIPGEIIQNGRCYAWVTTPGSNSAPINFCTFMLTKDALYLLQWDANNAKYLPLATVQFKDTDQVADARLLRLRQIQFIQKTRLVAFEAVEDDGGGGARDETTKLFEVVKASGVRVGASSGYVKAPQPPTTFIPVFLGK